MSFGGDSVALSRKVIERCIGQDYGKERYSSGISSCYNEKKARIALALAISLWIGGAGVAWADEHETVYADKTVNTDESDKAYSLAGNIDADKGEGITFTVESGGKVKTIKGKDIYVKSSGNTVTVKSGGEVNASSTFSDAIIGGACNNEVIVEGTVTGNVYGGRNAIANGMSTNNHVVVTGTVSGAVYGGSGDTATGNKVEILGGTVGGVTGGEKWDFITSTTTNNTVVLDNATVNGDVWGGSKELDVTGNTLIVSGKNTVGGDVARFKTIKLASDLVWDSTKVVLTAAKYYKGSIESSIDIDISEASALKDRTERGTMTLLKATDWLTNFTLSGSAITTEGVTVQSTAKSSEANGVIIGYNNTHTVALANSNKDITYSIDNYANKITLGTILWNKNGTARALTAGEFTFNDSTTIDKADFEFNTPTNVVAGDSMTLLSNATGLTAGEDIAVSQSYTNYANGIRLDATLNGNITRAVDTLGYTATGTTLDGVELANWNGTATAVPDGWTANLGSDSIKAAGFDAPDVDAGASKNILTAGTDGFFSDNQITGAMKYTAGAASSDTINGVTMTGSESKGVKASADGKSLIYARSNFKVSKISFGNMTWGTGRIASEGDYDYAGAAVNFNNLTFSKPETISTGTTTLLTANNTLSDIAETVKAVSYGYVPVAGVSVDGLISGSYKAESGTVTYTATGNTATSITFGNVEWKDSGALIDHAATLSNVSFNGADVDTSGINFTNISELAANKKMTLVSSFGDSVGTITGTKYKVGSTLEGEGAASLSGNDLVFSTSTAVGAASGGSESGSGSGDTGSGSGGSAESGGSSGSSGGSESGSGSGDTGSGSGGSSSSGGSSELTVQEQTHNTVMGAEVSMAALSAGNEFVGAATEGLALAGNAGADGMATFAKMGGGTMRQETGSHVDTHTWNAIFAIGHKNEKPRADFEYGAFFEYGKGNYTTHNGDERGDGSTHYTGGGLLAKWQAKTGTYVEGSLRLGTVHDDASNVLRNAAGVPYSYTTNASYWGAHLGAGREISLSNEHILDIYAKYFFNHRGSVAFDVGGHYDLDAVNSKVISIGTKYRVKKDKWSLYGGVAFERELDGKAGGRADGLSIRGADISGNSVKGELGATMKPGENSPWTLDFNVTGFAGKKRGISGGVSVKYSF